MEDLHFCNSSIVVNKRGQPKCLAAERAYCRYFCGMNVQFHCSGHAAGILKQRILQSGRNLLAGGNSSPQSRPLLIVASD
ncbi:MAG: hypothetical protein ACI8X5_002159 [Planctomycetota bacterium]|jgi:hypothetical protein